MYIRIGEYGHLLEMRVGKKSGSHDYNLLVNGVAASINKALPSQISFSYHIGEWVLLMHYSDNWREKLKKVFTDLRLEIEWASPVYLECDVNDYLIDQDRTI